MAHDPNRLSRLIEIAHAAGAAILEHYGSAARSKADGSPVTAADHAAERVILDGLSRLAPGEPILSEEQVAAGIVPRLGAVFWCVDPLDGTKEFVAGRGEFTVCIARIEDGRATTGVLHAPAMKLTYGADGGVAVDGAGRCLQARVPPAPGPVALVSRSHSDGVAMEPYLAGVSERRVLGSAIKFGLIAAGEADLYVRIGPTSEWDTAAGQAVLEAAGGTVTMLDGAPLRYGKPGFGNPGFVARGRISPV